MADKVSLAHNGAAFYAGSFDPLTNGHLGILYKTLDAFDRVVMAVGHNPNKQSLFSLDTRVELLRRAIADDARLRTVQERIRVTSYSGIYLVAAAVQNGCDSIVRGVRNNRDFEDENLLATLNNTLCDDLGLPRLRLHLFNAEPDMAFISSTMVKAMIGFSGWEKAIRRYVPPAVLDALMRQMAA